MKTFNLFEKLWEHGRTLRRVGLVLVMCLMAIPHVWAGVDDNKTVFLDLSNCSWYTNEGYVPRIQVCKEDKELTDEGASGGQLYSKDYDEKIGDHVYRFEIAKEARWIKFYRYNNGSWQNLSSVIWINSDASNSSCCYKYHNYFEKNSSGNEFDDSKKTCLASTGGMAYFYAGNLTTTTYVSLLLGRWDHSKAATMSLISNTDKLYYSNSLAFDAHAWTAVIGTSEGEWTDADEGASRLDYAPDHTFQKYGYKFLNGSTYYLTKESTTTGSALNIEYKADGYGTIPKCTTTVAIKVKASGSSIYANGSTSNSPATTIQIQGTNLNGNGTSTRTGQTATWSSSSSFNYASVISGYVTVSYSGLGSDWNFDGWYIDDEQVSTNSSHSFYQSANTNIEARFSYKYSVTYNSNGASSGTVPTDANTYVNGASVTVLGKNTLAKTNYGFAGWRTSASSGTWRVPTETFSMGTANVTLYAQWVAEANMVLGTMYKADNMKASAVTSTAQYKAGISANGIFEVLGAGIGNAEGGPMEYGSDSQTIDGTEFSYALHFKGEGTGSPSGTAIPTARAIKFRVGSAGKLHLWVRNSGNIKIFKSGSGVNATAIGLKTDKSREHVSLDVTSGTYYLYATTGNTSLYGMKLATCESITSQPTSIAKANVGEAQELSVTAAGTNLTYQWQTCNSDGSSATNVSGAAYSGGTTATLTYTPSDPGVTYYKCVVSGDCEPVTSDVVSITAKNAISSPTLTYSSTTIEVGETSAVPTSVTNPGSGTVTYSSSAEGVATVASDGKVTGVSTGSATITASIPETTNYWDATATASFTVDPAFVGSTSVNIEQAVLSNGTSWDYASALTSANIDYDLTPGDEETVSLDNLNYDCSKTDMNNDYRGLKIKSSGKYIEVNLAKGNTLKVRFGHRGSKVGLKIDGVAQSDISKDDNYYTYSLAKDDANNRVVRFTTKDANAVVIKQIMIGEDIADVDLPAQINIADGITNGSISASSKANVGSTVTVTVTPSDGYELETLTYTACTGGAQDIDLDTKEFEMPNSKVTLNATFVSSGFTLTNVVNTVGYGTVSPASVADIPSGTATSTSSNTYAVNGTTVTATPTPATAEYTYAFSSWSGLPATVTENATVTANFTRTPVNYTLTWDLAGGTVSTAGTGADKDATGTPYSSVAYGSSITKPVVTKSGCDFAGWDVTPAATMPAENTTYTAQWATKYTVTFEQTAGYCATKNATGSSVNPITLPTPSGLGVYEFLGWYTSAGTRVGGAGEEYTPTAGITLYAKWQASCSGGTGSVIYKAHVLTSGMTSNKSAIEALSSNTSLTTDNYLSELSGGTFTLALTASNKATVNNDSTIGIKDKDKAYFVATLTGGKTFQAGDIITLGVYAHDGLVQKGTSSSALNDARATKDARRTLVVPSSWIGGNTFYIYAESNGMNFAYVDVYRPGTTLFFAEVDQISSETDLYNSGAETEQTTSTYLESISGGKLYTKGSAANYAKVVTSHEISLRASNDNTYIKLALDEKLAEGDKIIINTSTPNYPFGITTTATRSTIITAPYTIPAKSGMIDQQTIYLWRNSSDSKLRSVAIVRHSGATCYHVTYDGNGATSGFMDNPRQYTSGDYVWIDDMLSYGYEKTGGYEFNGWNTKPDGSGDDYSYNNYPLDHFIITQDTTLYAQWRIIIDENRTNLNGFEDLKHKDVRVTNGATLTLTQDTTVRNMLVETGSTLHVAKTGGGAGVTLTAKSLALQGGYGYVNNAIKYDMPRVYIEDDSKIKRTSNIINFDIAVDNNSYYPFALPFDVPLKIRNGYNHAEDPNIVDYANFTLAYYSNYGQYGQFAVKTYNGQRRANYGSSSANWEHVSSGTTLKAGHGYALTALPAPGYGDFAVIRFPMVAEKEWTSDGEIGHYTDAKSVEHIKDTVHVTAYKKTGTGPGTGDDTPKKNIGWNLLGVPYMACYQTSADMYSGEGAAAIIQGKFDYEENKWDDEDKIRYVSVPKEDFSEYAQYNIVDEGTKLLPGWCFFVQIETSGILKFLSSKEAASSSLVYAPRREKAMPTLKTGIILSGNDASDKTTILVSDKYSAAEYEINADLEKMFGEDSYTLATYSLSGSTRLAFNAMSNADAANIIPIGYRAPAGGEYTFSINPRYAENGAFEHVNLIDYETGIVTDLLLYSYTFSTERTQNDARFALNVVPRQDMPTDIENGASDASDIRKMIINDQLYIILNGKMYDATGKAVK